MNCPGWPPDWAKRYEGTAAKAEKRTAADRTERVFREPEMKKPVIQGLTADTPLMNARINGAIT